jgi:flagellar FliL protein
MAKPTKPAAPAAAPAGEAVAPPKSKKKLIIVISILLLVIGGGAAWYFTKGHTPPADHSEEAKHEPEMEPKFVALGEKFTVNLQREEGDQYLQAGITLKILDPKLEEKIKVTMPELRSKLLFLLSSKKPSELVSSEGKKILVEQIIAEADTVLGVAGSATHAITAPSTTQSASHVETAPHGDSQATSAPIAASAVMAPAAQKKTGVVDVLFSDFIIQ